MVKIALASILVALGVFSSSGAENIQHVETIRTVDRGDVANDRYVRILERMDSAVANRDCLALNDIIVQFSSERRLGLVGEDPKWQLFYYIAAAHRLVGEIEYSDMYIEALRLAMAVEMGDVNIDEIGCDGELTRQGEVNSIVASEMCGEIFYGDYGSPTDQMRLLVERYRALAYELEAWDESARCELL